MVPAHMLPHDVVVVDPATSTDAYNDTTYDYGPSATRTTVRAWVQQDQRAQPLPPEGRDLLTQQWLMVTNTAEIPSLARIEWTGHPSGTVTFALAGPVEPAYTPAGYHHTEATLRIVEG